MLSANADRAAAVGKELVIGAICVYRHFGLIGLLSASHDLCRQHEPIDVELQAKASHYPALLGIAPTALQRTRIEKALPINLMESNTHHHGVIGKAEIGHGGSSA